MTTSHGLKECSPYGNSLRCIGLVAVSLCTLLRRRIFVFILESKLLLRFPSFTRGPPPSSTLYATHYGISTTPTMAGYDIDTRIPGTGP